MFLSIKDFSVNHDHVPILKGINLDIREGEFVCILGKSGCGKTTLLHALAGFIPCSGDIIKPDHIGMVFQNNAVFPWMTVAENIAFGLSGLLDKAAKQKIIFEYLQIAGLEEKEHAYPSTLSGGQVQRAAFARTLAHDPDLILMDEPFCALDAYTREQMQCWLLDVWSMHKKTILFVTHSIDEAIFLADRVVVLRDRNLAYEFHIPFARPRKKEVTFSPECIHLKKELSVKLT